MNARFVAPALGVLAVLCLVAMATFAKAQQLPCADHADAVKELADKYQEKIAGIGIMTEQLMVELFLSEKGTFTVLVTTAPSGKACIIAAGKDWEYDTTAFKPGQGT